MSEQPAARLPRRHAEIVRAAREVFLAEGYSGASMDQITAAASVSKQSIYRTFTDKRGLFIAVLPSSRTPARITTGP